MLFTNPARDYHTFLNNTFVEEGVLYTAKAMGNYLSGYYIIPKYLSGKSNPKNKYERYFVEFVMNGGVTGMSHLLELKDIQKEVDRELKYMGKNAAQKLPYSTVRFLSSAFEGSNLLSENMARFAIYATSRNEGRSVIRSVSDAKEVTVNFNRHGAGGMGNSELRKLYAFVNVGIQGTENMLSRAGRNPVRFAIATAANLALSYAFLPYINSILASLFGDDDDENAQGDNPKWVREYAKLSQYERNGNICIYTGNGFLKIPLSQEYRMYNGLGTDLFLLSRGYGKAEDMAGNFVTAMGELIAFNPVLEAHQGSWANALPTTMVSPAEIVNNTDFAGRLIYNPYIKESLPAYTQVRTNRKGEPYAPQFLINSLETANRLTGGDEVNPGLVSKLKAGKVDLSNPDILNHLLRSYLGGLYTMTSATIENLTSDESVGDKLSGIFRPGAMFKSLDDLPATSRYEMDGYYDAKKEITAGKEKYERLIKEEGIEDKEGYLNESPLIKYGKILSVELNKIEDRSKHIKDLEGEEQKRFEMEINRDKILISRIWKRIRGVDSLSDDVYGKIFEEELERDDYYLD
jgi:hypothetical protein